MKSRLNDQLFLWRIPLLMITLQVAHSSSANSGTRLVPDSAILSSSADSSIPLQLNPGVVDVWPILVHTSPSKPT